jgi:hypothetical protein
MIDSGCTVESHEPICHGLTTHGARNVLIVGGSISRTHRKTIAGSPQNQLSAAALKGSKIVVGRIDGVHYEELTPILLKEAQRQKSELAAQNLELSKLERQLTQLQTALEESAEDHARGASTLSQSSAHPHQSGEHP